MWDGLKKMNMFKYENNKYCVCISSFIFVKKGHKRERGKEKMIYDTDKNRVLFCVLCFCRDVGNGWIRFPWKQ